MDATSGLTGSRNYFEDFSPGEVYEHVRGKTLTEMDNVLITNLVLNTAEGHFNEDRTGRRVVFGGITASLVIGLAMEDTGENVLAELGLDKVRFGHAVFHGDTIYSLTEVLQKDGEHHSEAGEVRFRHVGFNQDGNVVFEGERRALVKKRQQLASGI
jgi:acyl dehydratase